MYQLNEVTGNRIEKPLPWSNQISAVNVSLNGILLTVVLL